VTHSTTLGALERQGRVRIRLRCEATVYEIVFGSKSIPADRG
jgi:hypothetical protein